ncbi:MAG: ferric reductase-like transmembrane domain-containing protein [Candidatus Micrarchaeia archaeon]|jgi:DMSO/TMAO reductase YedYZ heme-binding membrane subunit
MDLFVTSITLIVLLLLFTFYGYFEVSMSMANKISALAALALLGIAFLLGPLSKLWPSIFQRFKQHRRWLGITGVILALIHIAITLATFYKFNIFRILTPSGQYMWGVYAGLAAIIIFCMMALISNKAAVKRLGYSKWKLLQMTGYLAMALVIAHFLILETKEGVFKVRPLGYALFIFGILVILARIAIRFLGLPPRKKYEEHVS